MKIEIFKQQDLTEIYLSYIPKVITIIKSIDGAKYSKDPIKKWTIPTTQLDNLVSQLEENKVEINYLSEPKVFDDVTNKENKEIQSVQVSMDNSQFTINLPVPSNVYAFLYNTPKKITNKTYVINNQYFSQFFTYCFSRKIKIIMN